MAAPTVQAIAQALGNTLNVQMGIRYYPYLSDTFSPPCSLVAIDTVEYHTTGDPNDAVYTYKVIVLLQRSADRTAIETLEGYMSASDPTLSIRAALEADGTQGGIVGNTRVTKTGPPSSIAIDAAKYLTCEFEVTVWA